MKINTVIPFFIMALVFSSCNDKDDSEPVIIPEETNVIVPQTEEQETINVGSTSNYIILAGSLISNVPTSALTGDIGLSPASGISAGLSLLIFVFLLAKRQMTRKGTVLVFLVTVLLVLSVSWFGWNPVFERFAELQNEQNSFTNGRLNYWRDGLNLTRDFKLTGAGFGTFGDIYPFYQSISEDNFVKHAHNDYIELAAEGGVIAFVL
ncbi:MAG: O-antigen ligase family protein, partial [Bacteroidales bacterium]